MKGHKGQQELGAAGAQQNKANVAPQGDQQQTSMDYRSPEAVPLLDGPQEAQPGRQQKAEVKRSKLLTVCPFILGGCWLLVCIFIVVMLLSQIRLPCWHFAGAACC